MKVTINSVEQLYELDRALFNQIKGYLGITSSKNIYRVNLVVDLPIAFAEAVKRFQTKNLIELWDEQKAQERNDAEKVRIANDEKEAIARTNWWLTQGLLSNNHNLQLLRKIISEKMDGYLCAMNIDSAITTFRDEFQWKQVEPTPPPPPVEPPPPPVVLSDGSHQLPLATSPSTRHTVAQLRDLDARTRAAERAKIREANNALAAASKPVALEIV